MSFRRDLDEWLAWKVSGIVWDVLSEDIRRLLKGADNGLLPPDAGTGLPAEILEGYPPTPEIIGPTPSSAAWLCWPSADNAEFGWGDPYENPPGVPVNPPLGTVQPSYSDTALIAREIGPGDVVTHGVNKIAAPRDWRHDATPLVVSWDSTSIYSGGAAIVTLTYILAACVRWESGIPYLLWLRTSLANVATVYAQQCEITDDNVTGVTGSITSATLSGGMTDAWWCDFSQNASMLALNLGADVETNKSYSASIPWPLSGQVVAPVLAEEAKLPVTNWTDGNQYDGVQELLIKSQFVANVLTHVWLEISIDYSNETTGYLDPPITSGDCNQWSCFWTFCDDPYYIYTWNDQHPSSASHIIKAYDINTRILLSTSEIYTGIVEHIALDTWRWTVNAAEGDAAPSGQPPLPPSTHGPFPGWCPAPPSVDIINENEVNYRCVPRQSVDARAGSLVLVDFGDGTTTSSSDRRTWLKIEAHREGMMAESDQISGNFGYFLWPRSTSYVDENKLKQNLLDAAKTFCPADNLNIPTKNSTVGVVSVFLSGNRSVSCAWGLDEDDGETYYVNWLEGADIDTMLSIDGETNPRIVIEAESRYMGLLKQ